nr:uncharacterized protein LOC121502738 [Drosophila kikkawai]
MVTPYDYQPTEKEKGGRHVKERLLVHNTVEGDDKNNQNLQDVQESSCPGCDVKKTCNVNGCKLHHNKLLHFERVVNEDAIEPEKKTSDIITSESTVFFHDKSTKKALFRYIPVTLHNGSRAVDVLALIDEGSSCTLMERKLADELGLDGSEEELCLKSTGDMTQTEAKSKLVCINVSAAGCLDVKYMLKGVRTVSKLDLPLQSIDDQMLDDHNHLRSVPVSTYSNARAQMIIGLDHIKICVPLEVQEADNDDLIAVRCQLGWSVYGQYGLEEAMLPRVRHVCQCTCATRALDEAVKAHFSLEAIGVSVPSKPLRSKEDELSLKIMNRTTKYISNDSRWETGLLWRYENVELPDSYHMALRRLKCLESKMLKNPELNEFLTDTMRNYEKKGPDLLVSLMGVLLRFRERPVAVSGDIREMFHQIKVSVSDQSSQKILCRNGEIDRPPDTYVMQVMTFGASCSPSLANFVLRRNAEQFGEKHPSAIKAFFRNTFVADWLESVDTEDQMIELATNVKDIHTKGGFEMRNWLSNSKSVLQSLNNSREPSPKYLGVEQELQEKVLGMWWLPESDMLTFVIRPELLQRSGVSWDDAIKEPDENDWMAWKALLIKLGDLRIPRYMYCSSSVKGVQLHVFVDASLDAYAEVAYLRVEQGGEIRCSLVASKNRVAPLKPISLPRMELMAAVLGLRLAKFLESELSTKIEKRIFWTDARDVLYWIKSYARKYPQFVGLRIGEILEGSEIEDWRWVPSEQNVADEGTKWTKKSEINSSGRWFTGPEFLLQGESQWPSRPGVDISSECELMYHDDKTRVNKSPIDSIMPDPLRFKRLERMRAAQKRVLDFLRYICKEPRGPELVRLFKLERYVEMDTVFIRACQEEAFADEIRCLK